MRCKEFRLPANGKPFLTVKTLALEKIFENPSTQNLQTSDAILVVAASPDAVSNSWVSYEIGMAEGLNKPIIVLTSNRYSPSDFREDLKSFPTITFDPEKPEGVAQEIAGRLTLLAAKK